MKSPPLISNSSSQNFNSLTQVQQSGLEDDIRSYECVVSGDCTGYQPMFGVYGKTLPVGHISACARTIMEMQNRVQDMEREHLSRMRIYPYRSPYDKDTTLYKDYLEFSCWKETKRYVPR